MTLHIQCFLIDDDPDDQEIFAMALQDMDKTIACSTADNCVEAIAILQNNPSYMPHCIFIDINMPKINGLDCLKAIKKIERLNKVPVYMYSTSADPRIIEESKIYGATDFIVKPTSISELTQTLSEIFYK